MTFDTMCSNLSPEFAESIQGRFDEMFLREVRERARLLFNLKVPLEEAIRRIQENVLWEFDDTWTGGQPAVHGRTREVVTGIYAHLGS
ncbi:MAG: hypothetical protein FJ098_03450 [Deltaproteobacteria bacterium]|nr:hypothetical protein [Deltaproteobacteria bacterium]